MSKLEAGIGASLVLVGAAVLLIDLQLPLGVAGGVPYVVVVLLSLWLQRPTAAFLAAGASSLFTIAGLFWSTGTITSVVLLNRSLAIFAIWTVAFLGVARMKALGAEVAELRELLPVCAWCKAVRDDEGFWHNVHNYLSRRLDQRLTHGICPECSREVESDFRSHQPAPRRL